MNIKERIIRSKIGRLNPGTNASLVEKLKNEVERPQVPAKKEEPHEAKKRPSERAAQEASSSRAIGSFRDLDVEVHLRSRRLGDIWLVPQKTAAARFEILPEELDFLSLILEKFNARIIGVDKNVQA